MEVSGKGGGEGRRKGCEAQAWKVGRGGEGWMGRVLIGFLNLERKQHITPVITDRGNYAKYDVSARLNEASTSLRGVLRAGY